MIGQPETPGIAQFQTFIGVTPHGGEDGENVFVGANSKPYHISWIYIPLSHTI